MINNIEFFLFAKGIRTYSYPVITAITPEIEVPIGDSLSTDLGWIYGISTQINGVTPKNATVPLPTAAQANALYLNLQFGKTWYMVDFKLLDLVFTNTAGGATDISNPRRFMPVNIPSTTDLKQSVIRNPTAATGFSTMITFHYVPMLTYEALVKADIIKPIDKGMAA